MTNFLPLLTALGLAEALSLAQNRAGIAGVDKDTHHQQGVATSFLQVDQEKTLPRVESVIATPKQVMERLRSHMSDFEASLAEVQHKNKAAVEKKKAEYEKELRSASNTNKRLQQMNEVTSAEIEYLRKSNKIVRAESQNLTKETDKLRADMEALEANLTSAQEYAQIVLKSSDAVLNNASELSVLAELEEQDAALERSRSKQAQLDDIGMVSLLQVQQTADMPKDLVQSLMSSLGDLGEEQNASLASLKASFDEEREALEKKHEALLLEQAKLNATRADEKELGEKLRAAAKHLKAVRDDILKQTTSLRQYAGRVSMGSETLSLLQVSEFKQSREATLPRVNQVLAEPTKVLEVMNKHVDTLTASLNEAQTQHAERIKKESAEYERKLGRQAFRIQALENANAKLGASIRGMQSSSAQLRKQAIAISAENHKLRSSFRRMQSNVTTALEFTATALGSAHDQLHNASELDVLRELDLEDERLNEEQDHANELQTVAGQPIAMLEISAGRSISQSPESDIMQTLMATLQQLEQEQNASAMELKAHFERQFNAGELRHQGLLEKQAQLNATYAKEVETNNKLLQAVEHLKEMRKKMVKDNRAIRTFMNELDDSSGGEQQGRSHKTASNTETSAAATHNETIAAHKAHHRHEKTTANATQVTAKAAKQHRHHEHKTPEEKQANGTSASGASPDKVSMLEDGKQLTTAGKDVDQHKNETRRGRKQNATTVKDVDHDRARKPVHKKQMETAATGAKQRKAETPGVIKSAESAVPDAEQTDSWLSKLKTTFWR